MVINPRQANRGKRSRLRQRVLREESICHRCGGEVDKTVSDPLAHDYATLDELVPVSLGGDPLDRENVRLAHRLCNIRASNNVEIRRTARVLSRLRTSRSW